MAGEVASPQRAGKRTFVAGLGTGLLVMSGVVLATSAGVMAWLGTQEVADAQLPAVTTSVVTSRVETGSVATRVNAVGEAVRGQTVDVLAPHIPASRVPVVTRVPSVGEARTAEGDVVVEVALRPVFVVKGGLTMFRQLGLGDQGPDVTLVQEALARLGYDPGVVDGVLGERTLAALRDLFEDRGYAMWSTGGSAASSRTPIAELVVPLGEIFFLEGLPVTAAPQCEAVGTTIADSPACRLIVGDSGLRATVPSELAFGIQIGDEVILTSQPDGASLTVASMPAPPTRVDGTDESGVGTEAGGGGVVEFGIAGEVFPLSDSRVPLVVVTEETSDDSLVVPSTAIRDLPSGAVVDLVHDQGTREVPISVVLCASGRCAVSPDRDGALAAGDEVLLHGADG